MKKYGILILFTLLVFCGHAQGIETDIFQDLKYESPDRTYSAAFKKDIFDNLIYSDNQNNKITYEKKYLISVFGSDFYNDDNSKIELFRKLIYDCKKLSQYEAVYSIDMFGKIIVKENKSRSAFSNQRGNMQRSVQRDITGTYRYESYGYRATLSENIFHVWTYEDSANNKFEFSNTTWNLLKKRYSSIENILLFLTSEFLPD